MRTCECGNQVANNARTCPRCGHRFTSAPVKFLAWLLGISLGLILLSIAIDNIFTSSDAVRNVPPPSAAATKTLNAPPAAVAGANAGTPPNGFRNFKWGSAPRGNIKKFSELGEGSIMYVAEKPLSLFEVPVVEEDYSFVRGRFYGGDAYLDGRTNFEKMKTALMKTFGSPSFANENLQLWRWRWPGSAVEVSLYYQSRFARSTVTYQNSEIK
jgi:hypothetical protein